MGFIRDEAPWQGGKVSARVLCIRADNPSPMTYTGTNTYIVAEPGSCRCIVVDPAPEGEHVDRVLTVCGEHGWSIGAIVATHDHPDHINGIPQLAVKTGAPVYAPRLERVRRLFAEGKGIDAGFPAIQFAELQPGRFHFFEGAPQLEVVPLPGHSADSVGLLLVDEQLMFTGDVLFRHGPTVVLYPDGNLACYLESLNKLEQLARSGEARVLYPAHGYPIEEPLPIIEATRQHREERLQQVRDAIAKGIPAEPDALFDAVYTGVDPRLKPASVRSIQAQLEYLGYSA